MKNETCSITFGGVGGQGVLTASEICGWAAMYAGHHVKKSEVHGMAQRGGSVESHLRFGKKVYSPIIALGGADYLVCFYHDEHPRLKAFLSREGTDLTGYLDEAQSVLDSPWGLNTCLVGVLSAKLSIDESCWMRAIETVFKKKVVAENKKIFLTGRKMGRS